MKILLTGVTGYIAQRILPALLENGHHVVCCVRDINRFDADRYNSKNIAVIETDFLRKETLSAIPDDIDVAFYLIHSMAGQQQDFEILEARCAENFTSRLEQTAVKQVIYLSGIINETNLSKHLSSRKKVEQVLSGNKFALTTLRAGIIVGSGSASFEIIRDLVEKLPVMITPKWLNTKCQPIAIRNVLQFLTGVMLKADTYNKSYDIGGPDILTYKEMLLLFAKVRDLKRRILVIPVMTPKLSSYWLYFVTSTSYTLAKNLVNSMKIEVICKTNNLAAELGIILINYTDSIKMAFDKIEQNLIVSSWKDALTSNTLQKGISQHIEVPENGCFRDVKKRTVSDEKKVLERLWSIGGKNGWFYANWLWSIRGFLDQLAGGVGLRRGRKSASDIKAGDTLDFWRVLLANKTNKRLLLYAEMKLPGEAWLEFEINANNELIQTATFRPRGVSGRLYWYAVLPFHSFIFNGLINRLVAE